MESVGKRLKQKRFIIKIEFMSFYFFRCFFVDEFAEPIIQFLRQSGGKASTTDIMVKNIFEFKQFY